MKYTRIVTVAAFGSAVLLLAGCAGQAANPSDGGPWEPTDTVEVAVGAAPGGGSDILARAFAADFQELTGHDAVVENYDNVEGVLVVQRESGNGEMLGVGNWSNMLVRPTVQDAGYAWRDLTQLAIIGEDISYVVAKAGVYGSAEEMLEEVRSESATVGQVGSGSGNELLIQQLETAFGIDARPVAFEGGGDVIRGVVSGDIDLAVMNPGEFMPQVEAGELEPLLSTASEPSTIDALADVPLASELGADENFATFWRNIFGPPDLSDEQRAYWEGVIQEWTESDAYDEYLASNFLQPALVTGDELIDFMEQDEAALLEIVNGG